MGPSLTVMSIAYLLPNATDAVVWRGPRKTEMIRQFVLDVEWGPLDYLIVDTPPGTSDEHMTICELLGPLNPTGAVIVTTPQMVSTDDVRKELSFCHKLKLRCLGIVENMSGFVCPHCAECTAIFSSGGGRKLCEMYDATFLGAIPIDPALCVAEDEGRQTFVSQLIMNSSSSSSDAPVNATATTAAAEGPPEGLLGGRPPPPSCSAAAFVGVIGEILKQVARVDSLSPQRSD